MLKGKHDPLNFKHQGELEYARTAKCLIKFRYPISKLKSWNHTDIHKEFWGLKFTIPKTKDLKKSY